METPLTAFEDFEFLQFDQDSDLDSLWEFIDISESDSDSLSSFHHLSNSEPPNHSGPTIVSSDGPTVPSITTPLTDPTRARRRQIVRLLDLPFQTPHRIGVEDDDVSGDEEEDEDGYGLDDELVPWAVSDKVGRERMRKLGKRTFAKMLNSKRSPYLVVRPGCVRGKHGLGLKHIY